jgi:small-conductance mechanosensitive channel
MAGSLSQYLAAVVTFIGALAAFLAGRRLLLERLRALAGRTATDADDLAVELLGKIRSPEACLVAFFIATRPLDLPGWLDRGMKGLVLAVVVYRTVTIIQGLASYAVNRTLLKDPAAGVTERNAARNISYLVTFLIWLGGLLFVLSNLGINITSFVAGLGIGGVAVALAAQAILGDLFSALAIYLDKPFVAGDFIVVDDFQGTVERIGIKTTRVRSLSGELLIFPNSNLTSSRVRNFKQMVERRVVLRFQAAFETPLAKLKVVPGLIKAAVSTQDKVKFDRAHLSGLGESSVDFEAVYYVLDADYALHMDIQQEILLSVLAAFEKEGVSIPYPTRTLVQRGAPPQNHL